MESKNAEGIRNLLLKIVFPLAFPLAGAFISDLIANRANRHSYTDSSSDNSLQPNQSYGSICQGEVEEEEEEEMDSARRARRKTMAWSENTRSTAGTLLVSDFARQASNAEEIMVVEATESCSSEAQVSKQQLQDDQRVVLADDEVVSLKLMVSALEERASGMEAQFHEYCDMKQQESEYQKMQIMCLGMKLELLESQNQRLEAAAAEVRAAAGELAAMRGRLERLQSKVRAVSRRSKQESGAAGERIAALDAKQALMARRCEEFERCVEEMKQLTLQLQEQRGAANSENVEVAVERSLRNLSSGRDLVDGLEALRDRWAAGMEEMIYLGWITAWLQHDLMFCDDEDEEEEEEHGGAGTALGGSTYADDEEGRKAGHPPEEEAGETKKKGETMVAAAAPSNEVELCKAASVSSTGSGGPRRSVELERPRSCMGFAAAGPCGSNRDGAGRVGWSIGRPRLLRKLRGWAAGGGKGGGAGKRPCRVLGPCCQK